MNINTLNQKIRKGNWIVLYYSNSCGYCIDFMPIWDEFNKIKLNKLNKIKINNDIAHTIKINPGYQGVPTIHFYKNGKLNKKGIFNSERTLNNLILFSKLNLKKTTKTKKKKKMNRKTKRKKLFNF